MQMRANGGHGEEEKEQCCAQRQRQTQRQKEFIGRSSKDKAIWKMSTWQGAVVKAPSSLVHIKTHVSACVFPFLARQDDVSLEWGEHMAIFLYSLAILGSEKQTTNKKVQIEFQSSGHGLFSLCSLLLFSSLSHLYG